MGQLASVSQGTYVNRELPDLMQMKTYKRKELHVHVAEDVSRLARSLVDHTMEKEVPRFCSGRLHEYRYPKWEIEPENMKDVAATIIDVPPLNMEPGAKKALKNAMWAKGEDPIEDKECWWVVPCCLAMCTPLAIVLLPVFICQTLLPRCCSCCCRTPPPTELQEMKRLASLMQSLKAVNNEIKDLPSTMGCCCCARELEVSKVFIRHAIQFDILGEIFIVLRKSISRTGINVENLIRTQEWKEADDRGKRAEKREKMDPEKRKEAEEIEFLAHGKFEVGSVAVDIPEEAIIVKLKHKAEQVGHAVEIEKANLKISEWIRRLRVAQDDVANQLLTWKDNDFLEGSEQKRFEKFTVLPDKAWLQQDCHSYRWVPNKNINDPAFEDQWAHAINKNYTALTGGNKDIIPFHLRPITDLLWDSLNVISWTARVKEASSVVKNYSKIGSNGQPDLPGTIADLYGMRLFVGHGNIFEAFALASMCAHAISLMTNVKGVATKHSLKEATTWFDFKIVVKLAVAGEPVAEIQIVPVENFISDDHMKGHDLHKAGTTTAALKALL